MKIKALLFDLGNVLITYQPEIFISRLEERTRIPKDRLVKYFLTTYVDAAYIEGKVSSQKYFEVIARDLNLDLSLEEFRDFFCNIFKARKEMDELVLELKKKSYPLWVLSNTNEWHFEFLKANYPVLSHIDQFFLSHKIGRQKPDPKIYEHVICETGFKPEEIFFTDDIEVNISSARKAGLSASLFQSVNILTQELESLGVLNHEK